MGGDAGTAASGAAKNLASAMCWRAQPRAQASLILTFHFGFTNYNSETITEPIQ